MTAWRDVEVAAAEALDGPVGGGARGDPRRDLHGRGGQGARAGHGPRRRRLRRRARRRRRARGALDPLRPDLLRRARHGARAPAARGRASSSSPGARELAAALAERAREHAGTLCVGRTHGVHAEPTSFGLKLAGFAFEAHRNAERLERAFAQAATGAISGAVGTYASLGPDFEARVLDALGLAARARLDPGRAARPPRRAAAGDRAGRRGARAARHGGPPPPAHGGARGRGAVPRGAEGLERDAAQAQPDHHGAHHGPGPAPARLRAGGGGGRRAVARARHLALGRRAGDPARRDDRARLRAAPRAARRARHDRPRRPHAGQPRADLRRAVLPARPARARGRRDARATTPTGSSSASPRRRGTPRRRCGPCWSASPRVGLDLDAIFDYGHYMRHVPEVLARLEDPHD